MKIHGNIQDEWGSSSVLRAGGREEPAKGSGGAGRKEEREPREGIGVELSRETDSEMSKKSAVSGTAEGKTEERLFGSIKKFFTNFRRNRDGNRLE